MLLLLLACHVDLAEVAKAPGASPPTTPPASPPPAPTPAGEKLYQLLYAGEAGPQGRTAGEETRALAWLATMALTAEQAAALRTLVETLRARELASRAELEALGQAEAEALGPVYADITAGYRAGTPTDDQLVAWAARLEAARTAVYAGSDPRARRYAEVKAALDLAVRWVRTLDAEQRRTLDRSRFLLARELGPFAAPGDYARWSGTAWSGGEFSALRVTGPGTDEGHMDLGGLWISDEVEGHRPSADLQLAVLVFLAAQQGGMARALSVPPTPPPQPP